MMPLHPQAVSFLQRFYASRAPEGLGRSPADARAGHLHTSRWITGAPDILRSVHFDQVSGPGVDIPVRIYVPDEVSTGTMLYFHGGGWVVGTLGSYDDLCRAIALRARMVVVSVGYRLAPEHPYPAAVDDCLAAVEWAASGPARSGVGSRPLIVAGDSAGGNLATVVALRAKARGHPRIDAQVLIYPITDVTMSTQSYNEFGGQLFLTAADMEWFWSLYLGDMRRELDGQPSEDFSPCHAIDLAGLPPALVITAEFDPLRDEGEVYAERLSSAGVPTQLFRYAGMIHGFVRCRAICDDADRALDDIVRFVRPPLAGAEVTTTTHRRTTQ